METGLGRHAPDGIADVVGHEQGTMAVDGHSHGPALRFAVGVKESGQHVLRLALATLTVGKMEVSGSGSAGEGPKVCSTVEVSCPLHAQSGKVRLATRITSKRFRESQIGSRMRFP